MSRLVQRWSVRNGRLVKLGSTPYSAAQTVIKPFTYNVYQTGGTTVAPAPYPSFADYPVIKWEQLDTQYEARNLNTWAELPDMNILRNLTQRAYVELPEGFRGKIVDFRSGGTDYGVYAPNCMGLWGKGPEKAVIRMEPYSSTRAPEMVPQPVTGAANGDAVGGPGVTMMRLGPTNSSVNAAIHNYGFALFGTNQPDQPAGPKPGTYQHPHNYSGLNTYMGTGSTDVYLVIGGTQGDWNSPPGETFQYQNYRGKTQCFMDYCEVTGFNEAGIASGGPPTDYQGAYGTKVGGGVGSNGAKNSTYRWCNIHDAFVSGGPIFSGAGGPNGNLCTDSTTVDVKTWNNANGVYPNPGGRTFGGYNHEGALGNLSYTRPNIKMGPFQSQYHNPHFFFGGWKGNPDSITIFEPVWEGPQNNAPAGTYVNATQGLLIVSMPTTYAGQPNTNTTLPVITVQGNVLQPLVRPAGQGWPNASAAGATWKTHYMLTR